MQIQKSKRKKDGFNAQKAIVLPKHILGVCADDTIAAPLYITDIGYYPKAQYHYRERLNGIPQNILIYCIDGEGWAILQSKKFTIKSGQYLILPQNIKHIYGADDEKPWSIFWVHFKGNLSENFIDGIKGAEGNSIDTISFDNKRIDIFNSMYNTLENGYSIDNLRYVSMQLWNYLSTFCYPQLFKPTTKNQEDEVDVAIAFMQQNINQSFTLTEIARYVHRSTSHFSALFKKKTGYPPLEYFNHIKMQKACQQLEFSNINIKELSYQLGFNDPFYFSRLFSKIMGQSPMAYRKRKKFN